MVRILIAVVVLLVLASQSAYITNPGQQALVLELGNPVRIVREPGLYFKYPFIQEVLVFDKRVLVADSRPSEYMTLDKKRLMVDTVARWKIEDPQIFFQAVRNTSGAVYRLNDIISARLRQDIASHNFIDFIRERREGIMEQVTLGARKAVKPFGIEVIDVRIKRVDLPEEVQKSVFARMIAERERIAKRYRAEGDEKGREIKAAANKEKEIILAEAYRQSEVLRGDGDAEATAIYAAAYNENEEFFSFLRHLEVYRKVFATDTTILLRPDSYFLRFLESPEAKSRHPRTVPGQQERK